VETVRRCCQWTVFGLVPLFVAAFYAISFLRRGVAEPDFGTFWTAGRAVLHGQSPYPALASLPPTASHSFAPYVYPPVTAVLLAPIAALPFLAAKITFLAVSVSALVLALRLFGVRDWRCYGVALGSAPVFESLASGTISLLLLLGVAAAWRYRGHWVVLGALVASIVSAKLFLWPVWFWLVRTHRWRAAITALGMSLVAVGVSWAAIGFAGLHAYPALLGQMTRLEGPHSYSTYALQRVAGVGAGRASEVTFALGFIALVLTLRFVAGDRRSLIAHLGVSLVATPILWPHYLVLLLVPTALASPALTRVWLLPVLLWIGPTAWNDGHISLVAGELVVTAVAIAATCAAGPSVGERTATVLDTSTTGPPTPRARQSSVLSRLQTPANRPADSPQPS
jgi:Glycosyltransferase family 87